MVEVIRENWKSELLVARVYRALAEAESSPRRTDLFIRMAMSEEEHAEMWADRLEELGVKVDPAEIEGESRKQSRLVKLFGADAMIRRIEREERDHVREYASQILSLNDPASTLILQKVLPDEEAHAARLQEMAAEARTGPRSMLDGILSREKWHVGRTGSWIGDAIYGVNDGLGAVFGIVSAVSGATGATSSTVIVAGLAGMVGSAFSMGSSAWLAAKSEREVYEAEIAREQAEILADPEHEREELELMYQIKGFTEEEARKLGEFLEEKKWFDNGRASVQLNKSGGTYEVRLVVKKGIEQDPEVIAAMKQWASDISKKGFGSAPLDIHLCDENLQTVRVVVPER